MKNKGVTQFLFDHASLKPISFHMPGHKGGNIYIRYGKDRFLDRINEYDITEIIGADNLFLAEGIIKETAEKYTKLYNAKKSYLLVNGTSGGLIASILATVKPGEKLIMARNCHKSVFNALVLGNIKPEYVYTTVIEEYGISGAISVQEIEKAIQNNPEATAVVLPSPNYYGICSNVKEIAKVVHKYNKILIVDQAHGAHLKFFSKYCKDSILPNSAEDCGADIVVNSIHKTLASFTQSAVLNVNSGRIDLAELEDKLQMIESTSPSYLLMASLDINADIIMQYGKELFSQWENNLKCLYQMLATVPMLKVMSGIPLLDTTKINLDMSRYGFDGNSLEEYLIKKNIFPELATGNFLMCMTGIGNTREDMIKLWEALETIVTKTTEINGTKTSSSLSKNVALWHKHREMHKVPTKKKSVPIDECVNEICAVSVIPYPPGIPLICPGERISAEDIEYIKALRMAGEKVIGFSNKNELMIGVGYD